MAELEIMSLKPEYQKMVMNNQQKYNPNFDSKLSEEEIGVLMTDTGVSSEEELMAGLAVERTQPAETTETTITPEKRVADAQKEIDKNSLKTLEKSLKAEQKTLQVYKDDLQNGTIKGLNRWQKVLAGAGIGSLTSISFGLPVAVGVMIKVKEIVFKDPNAFAREDKGPWFLVGVAALAAVGAIGGAIYNACTKKSKSNEYFAQLPKMIEEQEQKCKELEQQIRTLETRI